MSSGEVIVGRLPQLARLEASAHVSDMAVASGYSPSRRRAFLAWRAVVRERLGDDVEIGYNRVGAPVVNPPSCHIGVSHCADAVAVVIADEPCAVDIEPLGRDITRVAPRVFSEEERSLSDHPLLLLALWCGKETLYKLSGRQDIDLCRDIRIGAVSFEQGSLRGSVCGEAEITLRMEQRDGLMIVTNVVDNRNME